MPISSRTFVAVVPAAGIGARMQAATPKQYLTLDGKTVLEHSVECLIRSQCVQQVIVALHPDDDTFHRLAIAQAPQIKSVVGGNERADSVLAALSIVPDDAWVLVHDAARPCLSQQDIHRLLKVCHNEENIGALLATPVRDTMKRASVAHREQPPLVESTVSRERLWHALTPQCFNSALLRNAILTAQNKGVQVTDEASAMEACGYPVKIIEGRPSNLKITYPDDLMLAQFYLQQLRREEANICE